MRGARRAAIERMKNIQSLDFQWYRENDYEPMFFSVLSDAEVDQLADWAEEIYSSYPNGGMSGIEMLTMLCGTIMSSGLTRVVQTGHYLGYSSLVMGYVLRYMRKGGKFFTIDADPSASSVTQGWIDRADLRSVVQIHVGDSSEPSVAPKAIEFLNGRPQLIYIDSSHQYEHTKREMHLWFDALEPGGLMIMDDVSLLAVDYDSTKLGGAHRAALEFLATVSGNGILVNGAWSPASGRPVYSDPCGLGIIQKPFEHVT